MLRRASLAAGLAVLVLASVTYAQPPGGPPGRGGFGRPGFGGPGGPQGSPAFLLGMAEVRKELGTSEAQNKQLDGVLAELQEQMRASFGNINFQEIQTMTPEEREKRFDEVRKKSEQANKTAEEKLTKLLDAKQLERLNQLRFQREGVAAFNRPEVAKQLSLTDDQQGKLRKVQEEGMPFFAPPEQRQKAEADALAVLTGEQKGKWAEMKGKEFKFPEPGFGFGPGGPGGPGGPMGQQRKLVKQFDKDGDGRLNKDERQAARDFLKKDRPAGGRPGGFGPPGGMRPPGGGFGPPGRGNQEPPKPGPRVAPEDVKAYPDAALYEPSKLRTLFLEFDSKDWEAELQDFHGTDVEVPATLTVDGKKYPNVGIHFRGMSSYMMVAAGSKRSLNLSLDFADTKQRLYGYKTLNLLNAHEDPSFLGTVLYSHIARQYTPAPKANVVKVVVNGESWGVYENVQQFDKVFLDENYKPTKGARWKVRGNPGADGGLRYLGENVEEYKRRFEIKSGDNEKDWKALIALCWTLDKTPPEQLEEALKPIVDLDNLLWFLALDVALINNDGYWTRASDYSLFRDEKGKFHFIPHDMNEAFHGAIGFGFGGPGGPGGFPGGRPGGPGGPGGGLPGGPGRPGGGPPGPGGPGMGLRGGQGVELDPLVGLENPRMPLRSKVLAVPSLRAKYLQNVRTIAEKSLDWKDLGPVVAQYRKLIEKEVEADTRKLEPFEAFLRTTADEPAAVGGRGREMRLRTFADQRRKYLLNYQEVKKAAAEERKP